MKAVLERLLVDGRSAAAALLVLGVAWLGSHLVGLPRAELAALALLPAALAHLALAYPRVSALARFAPGSIQFGYIVGLGLALLGARAVGTFDEAAGVAVSIASLLGAIAGVACAIRLARFARAGDDPGARAAARLALAGAAASALAIAARWLFGGGAWPFVAALAFPLASVAGAARLARRSATPRAVEAAPGGPVSLEQVARGIAHAMLKPVSASAQQLEILARQVEDPAVRTQIADVAELMSHLERLVRDVLDLARAQAGGSRRQLSLARVVQQGVLEVQSRHPTAAIEWSAPEGSIVGDELSLRCLIVNLLENALEADPECPAARVHAEHDGAWITIRVEDDAGGIGLDVKDRLFEPFVTNKPRGTGLGLAVAEETCRAHGGQIRAESLPGGTRFVIELPADTALHR